VWLPEATRCERRALPSLVSSSILGKSGPKAYSAGLTLARQITWTGRKHPIFRKSC